MMLRKRRRQGLYVTDSSDEDTQPRKLSARNKSYYGDNRSHPRVNKVQEDTDGASDTDFIHISRKKCKRLRLYSSEETDTTNDEEVVHPIRHGSVRALSDYESGTSSDGSGATEENTQMESNATEDLEMENSLQGSQSYADAISNKPGIFIMTMEQNENGSESSSTSSVISPSQNKRYRRSSNVVYSSESSESDMPIRMRRKKQTNRLYSSDEESDSTNASVFRLNGSDEESLNVPAHSSMQNQESRNKINTQSRIQVRVTDSDSSSSDENSSDSDIPINNNPFRNRLRYTTNYSSSDAEEITPPRLRRGAVIPLNESDGDDGITNENNVAPQTSALPKTFNGDSTDSDSESEKCTICLGTLNVKEIGVPSSCEHRFCLCCIQEWAKNNNTCPVDRKEFNELFVHNKDQPNAVRRIPIEIVPRSDNVNVWSLVAAAELVLAIERRNIYSREDTVDEDNWRSIFELGTAEEDEEGDGPEEVCHICFEDDDDNSGMVVCDECSRAFHLACVRLNYIPVQTWYCPSCASLN